MNRIKKLVIVSNLLISTTFLIGCIPNVENTKTEEIKATIIKTEYKPMYTTSIYQGTKKMPIITTHSEEYNIYLEYENMEYVLDNKEDYNLYKDKNSEIVNCELETRHYSDGKDIKEIKDIMS